MIVYDGLAGFKRERQDAAYALGFSKTKTFWLIVLPHVIQEVVPEIASAVAGLFRNLTLLSVIGFFSLSRLINEIRVESNWTGAFWELLSAMILFFGLISFAISVYARQIERKLMAQGRRRGPSMRIEE